MVGHCYEEGSLSLPYLAFVEALRSYALTRETQDLQKELGTSAADVARIVSEIREKLKVKLRPAGNPEEERYRLMQAVTGFLSNAATVQPLLVVLEDLHDADKGTLDMLTHVSRNLAGTRLLLVGTYRDIEVDRSHPLSAALAELRRVSTYGRVLLRGLNADEVRRMLESITRESIPWGLAEAVHRQTEGNPLFVQEVVRYLAEEGLITQKEGRWKPTKDTPLEMSIPEGLLDVIGKRLSLISPDCNQLLSIASVIGRDFRLEVLNKISDLSEEKLFGVLEEAKKAAIVEERAGVGAAVTYRFAHAFFRQTLYEETIAPRRIRLHQQVARALEEIYANRLEEHAAELAEHFSHSSDMADLKKAIAYGEMAAKRAMDVYAFGEAARLLDQALKVQEVLDPEDKGKQCDLLLALCEALILTGIPRRVLDVEAPAALAMAEAMGDRTRAARICHLAREALGFYGGTLAFASPGFAEWAKQADRYAEPGTIERVRADTMLGTMNFTTGGLSSGATFLNRALDLASRLDDLETLWHTTFYWLLFMGAPQHADKRLHLAQELTKASRAGVSLRELVAALPLIADVFISWGQRMRAKEICDELRDLAQHTGQVFSLLVSMVLDTIFTTLDGCLEDAVKMSQDIRDRGEELGLSEFAIMLAGVAGLRPYLHLGKVDDALRVTDAPQFLTIPARPLPLAHAGRDSEVNQMLKFLVMGRSGIGSTEDETPAWVDILLLESAVLIGYREVTDLLLRRLDVKNISTSGMFYTTCITRHLGGAAALLDRYDEARKHYQEAIKVCTEIRFRPELALSRLQLAELLLEHYPKEKKEALEHLDFAIKEFRDMKMQPSLERALRHKDILGA